MDALLKGKVALVTGGSTGIGEAICKLFARQGAKVVVNGLPGDPVEQVVDEIHRAGGTAIGCVGDAGTLEGSNACVKAANEAFGKLDVLVANAGLFPEQEEVDQFSLERFEELVHTNIRGTYLAVRAALPSLRKSKGAIIALGSEAGIHGAPEIVAYSGTKGFIHAFIRAISAEQAKYGVRANIVAPGPIDTEMTRPSKGNMKMKNAFMSIEAVPMGRRGTPEEVANVCLFLASDLSSFVNGAIYAVDGGSTASVGMPGIQAKSAAKEAPEGTVPLEHQHEGRGTLRREK
jgi:NAD(P)-dependent dehydrogenase (short-subunit alcohol dehydrogenase family)